MFAPIALALVSALASASAFAQAPSDDSFFGQVESSWIAVVKDGISAEQCAANVRAAQAGEVTTVLNTVGILLVTTPSLDKRALEAVSCIASVEADGIMFPL